MTPAAASAKAAAVKRAAFLALLLVAGCGSREPLRPAAGEAMPIKAADARTAPTTAELLAPPPIARPERTDENVKRSEEREDDPFDLPPSR